MLDSKAAFRCKNGRLSYARWFRALRCWSLIRSLFLSLSFQFSVSALRKIPFNIHRDSVGAIVVWCWHRRCSSIHHTVQFMVAFVHIRLKWNLFVHRCWERLVSPLSLLCSLWVCVCVWVLAKVLIVYHSSVFVQTSPETRMQSVQCAPLNYSPQFFFIHSIYIIYFLLLLLLSFAFLLLIWPYSTWHKFATCGLVDRFSGSSSS